MASTVPETRKILQQSLHPDIDVSKCLDFLGFPTLPLQNHSFYFFLIEGSCLGLPKRVPPHIPWNLLTKNRVNICFSNELSCLHGQVQLGIAFGNQLSPFVEHLYLEYQFGPAYHIHT